jgi:hypothetical protein
MTVRYVLKQGQTPKLTTSPTLLLVFVNEAPRALIAITKSNQSQGSVPEA